MKLRDYLKQNQIPQADFAQRVGTTPATINRICKGLTIPRRALMARIIAATDGAVAGTDLLILPGPAPATENAVQDERMLKGKA